MPVPAWLFQDTDPDDFRRWCAFQLYDMPLPTQQAVIVALRAALAGQRGTDMLGAMSVDLPGVGCGYDESWQMQTAIARSPFLLLFRFYTGSTAGLLPARVFNLAVGQAGFLSIIRAEERARARVAAGGPRFLPRRGTPTPPRAIPAPKGLLVDPRRGRPAAPGRRLGTSSHLDTPPERVRAQLALTAQDFGNMAGFNNESDGRFLEELRLVADMTDLEKAELWMSYKHQTGRRDNSPYLSCTAVMPRMVRSPSKVLRHDVMPRAPYLGLFLVPRTNFLVQWLHARCTDLDSVVHSVDEVEVLYRLMPMMECFQLLRFNNPFALCNGGHQIPGAGSQGETGMRRLLASPIPRPSAPPPGATATAAAITPPPVPSSYPPGTAAAAAAASATSTSSQPRK